MSSEPPETSGDPAPKDDDIARASIAAAALGIAFALTALATHGARAAWSVLVGAAIAVANLLAMRLIVRRLVKAPRDGDESREEAGDAIGGLVWGLLAVLKILFFFGGVWLLLTRQLVDPMPLVVGYGVLPLGIAASAVWSSLRGTDR